MTKHDGDLISRSALEKFIENGLNNPDKTKRFGHDAVEIIAEIHYTPAVDAVEVVRCAECKHRNHDGAGKPWCDANQYYLDELDFFCAYGERRADDERKTD